MSIRTSSALSFAPRVSGLSFASLIAVWRQRQHLARLDSHLLDDIGVTPAEAAAEVARPIWDAPAAWLR